jgi:hypothetical protein
MAVSFVKVRTGCFMNDGQWNKRDRKEALGCRESGLHEADNGRMMSRIRTGRRKIKMCELHLQ